MKTYTLNYKECSSACLNMFVGKVLQLWEANLVIPLEKITVKFALNTIKSSLDM